MSGFSTTTFSEPSDTISFLVNSDYVSGNIMGLNYVLDTKFIGTMDDIRIYNRALSPQEIWAIQSQGAS